VGIGLFSVLTKRDVGTLGNSQHGKVRGQRSEIRGQIAEVAASDVNASAI
jgi:hypothetical protein